MKNPAVFTIEGFSNPVTLTKAMPEWCNRDCPNIYGNDGKEIWRINSGGLYIESISDEWRKLFIKFVWKSSLAYYKKYPNGKNRNGFWENFVRLGRLTEEEQKEAGAL